MIERVYEDERWMPIIGFEGDFEISDYGRVRSLGRFKKSKQGTPIITPGKILKTAVNSDGYTSVLLQRAHAKRTIKVHREVARSFLGDPGDLHVLHADGNKLNNHVSNLRYGTHSQNQRDSVRHGTHNQASKTHCVNNHEFTPENTYIAPGSPHVRRCRLCIRAALARRRAKKAS